MKIIKRPKSYYKILTKSLLTLFLGQNICIQEAKMVSALEIFFLVSVLALQKKSTLCVPYSRRQEVEPTKGNHVCYGNIFY